VKGIDGIVLAFGRPCLDAAIGVDSMAVVALPRVRAAEIEPFPEGVAAGVFGAPLSNGNKNDRQQHRYSPATSPQSHIGISHLRKVLPGLNIVKVLYHAARGASIDIGAFSGKER
jgi:hypothetical protein